VENYRGCHINAAVSGNRINRNLACCRARGVTAFFVVDDNPADRQRRRESQFSAVIIETVVRAFGQTAIPFARSVLNAGLFESIFEAVGFQIYFQKIEIAVRQQKMPAGDKPVDFDPTRTDFPVPGECPGDLAAGFITEGNFMKR
jgi:hypothetical protein